MNMKVTKKILKYNSVVKPIFKDCHLYIGISDPPGLEIVALHMKYSVAPVESNVADGI